MNARGFTLVEWLIAMLIGVFLIGGGLSIFVASRATTEDAFSAEASFGKMAASPCVCSPRT